MIGRLANVQPGEKPSGLVGRLATSSSPTSGNFVGRMATQKTASTTQPVQAATPTPTKKVATKKNSKLDDVGVGIGASLLSTVSEMSKVGEKILQAPLKLLGMKFDKKTSAEQLENLVEKKTGKEEGSLFEPENETQSISKAVTDIAQYFIPGAIASKVGAAAKVATAAKAASLASKGTKAAKIASTVVKAVPYLTEGAADAALSAPLVVAQSKGENKNKELLTNSAIALAAPGVLKVVGQGAKTVGKLIGRMKGLKTAAEVVDDAARTAEELTARNASKIEKNLDEGINIPGKTETAQNEAVLAAKNNAKEGVIPPKTSKIANVADNVAESAVKKESQFAKNVSNADITKPEVKKILKENPAEYDTVTNVASQEKAVQRIANEGSERAAAFVRSAENSDDTTATGVELIRHYQQKGDFDLAADMADTVSQKLTKAGQAIQAAKIYENLSPETVLLKAQRFIKEQNDKIIAFSPKSKLTNEDSEKLYDLAKKMQSLNGDAKTEVAAEIGGILGSYKRSSIGKKISSIQTQAQLLNPKTYIRNVIGNELFYRLDRLSKLVALPFDIARSSLTGADRTIVFKRGNQENFWKNWMKGTQAGWKGIDLGTATQYDIKNHVFKSKLNPFYWGEKAVGATLKGFDHAAYRRAYGDTLYEIAYLNAKKEGLKGKALKDRAIKLLDKLDAKAHELADHYGKYATFQDDSLLSKGAISLKKSLNFGQDFGLGDLLLKYPKTPANLLSRALEYSPVGFARAFKIVAEPVLTGTARTAAQNKEIAMATARAIVGSLGFTGFGYFLAEKGMITGKRSSNKDIAALDEQMGRGEFKINVSAIRRFVLSGFQNTRVNNGDTYFSYDWAQPVSVALSIGANLNQKEGTGALQSFTSGLNTLVEQPLLSGVLNFMKYGDISDSISTTLEGMGASFTPTLLNQFRQYTDNLKRQTRGETFGETFMNRIENRIPGASTKLAPQIDTSGEAKTNFEKNNIFNVFLNPGNVSTFKQDPGAKLVLDLIEATGEDKIAPQVVDKTATLFGRKTLLTPEEQAAMQQYTGKKFFDVLNRMAESKQFAELTNEEKVDALSKKLTELGSNVRALLMAKRAREAKQSGNEEEVKLMRENVSPGDVKRFNAAYQLMKEKDMFKLDLPENNGTNRGEQNKEQSFDLKSLPMIGAGLGIAAITKGKDRKLLNEATESFFKSFAKVEEKDASKIFISEMPDIIAMHSTDAEGMKGILKDKKIWGPSVAILDKSKVKKDFGFGDYHVVINKKSIDPARKDVVIFSDDAYTPRMITDEQSVKQMSEMFKKNPDLLKAGEIDSGEIPLPVFFADRIDSLSQLVKETSKLGTREEARNFYFDMMTKVNNAFDAIVPAELKAQGLATEDLAERFSKDVLSWKDKGSLSDPRFVSGLFKEQYGITLPQEKAESFMKTLVDLTNTKKVEYLEAKYLRGVDLSETDYFLVPDDADKRIVNALKASGVKYQIYEKTGFRGTNLDAIFKDVYKNPAVFGISIIPFGFKGTDELEQKLQELKDKRDSLKKENEDLQAKTEQIKTEQEPEVKAKTDEYRKVAATIFAEALGEDDTGRQAVYNVIKNRADKSKTSLFDVVSKPHQFDGFNKNNKLYSKALKYLRGDNVELSGDEEKALEQIVRMIQKVDVEDVTGGSTHYLNPATANDLSWSKKLTKMKTIGKHDFYKE